MRAQHSILYHLCKSHSATAPNSGFGLADFSMYQKPAEESRRFLISLTCKVVTVAIILVMVAEILIVQQWGKWGLVSVKTMEKLTNLTQTDKNSSLLEGANYAVRKYLSLQVELQKKLKTATSKKVIKFIIPILSNSAFRVQYGTRFIWAMLAHLH